MPTLHRSVLRTLTTVAAAAGVAVAMALQASAATVTVTEHFDCQGQTPLGAQQFGLDQDATVTAPDTAAPGSDVTIVIDPAPNTIPSSVNGYTVKRVENMNL